MVVRKTCALAATTVSRLRATPAGAEFMVRSGQRVELIDVVAQYWPEGAPSVFDVARIWGGTPRQVEGHWRIQPGDEIRQGESLAERRGPLGMGRMTIPAPVSGRVLAIANGQVIVEAASRPIEVRAGMPGVVTSVADGVGVTIETTAVLAQAAWSNGREAFGALRMLADHSGRGPMRGDVIDLSYRGAIIVSPAYLDEISLRQADEMQVRGLVAGSMPASLIPLAIAAAYPVVITEAFGRWPMDETIYSLLHDYPDRQAILGLDLPGGRPEILIPLPTTSAAMANGDLQVGRRVRGLRAPYLGQTGTIQTLFDREQSLSTGQRIAGAQVLFDGGVSAFLPYQNFELLLTHNTSLA